MTTNNLDRGQLNTAAHSGHGNGAPVNTLQLTKEAA